MVPRNDGITYLVGDATAPAAESNAIIAHVCNDVGGWGRGFVVAISKRWPEPEAEYRSWYEGRSSNGFGLGEVQLVKVSPDWWVANMIGQRDTRSAPDGTPPIRYEALEAALGTVSDHAMDLEASVHMPRIGCGLAGGEWDRVEAIIRRTLVADGVEVVVYDLA